MDFLEGFLLGPTWSDTEYETRRHTGFYWLIGWLVFLGYIWLQFDPPQARPWMSLPRWAPLLVFFFLLLAAPFTNRYYYRLNILLKLPVLALQAIKLAAAYLAVYQWVMPFYKLDVDLLPQELLEYINQTIAKSTETFTSMGQAMGMMVGVIAGGLQVVLTFVGILLVATIAPALFLVLLQLLQRGVDYLAHHTLLRNIDF